MHGHQEDGFSCGPCAINTVRHAVFGEALWTPVTRGEQRIQAFNRLVDTHRTFVSFPCGGILGHHLTLSTASYRNGPTSFQLRKFTCGRRE